MEQIESIIQNKTECFFISPHLDDAALSAGGLIAYLSQRTKVHVITLFTEALSPSSISAKQFLKQCHQQDPKKLFQERREEDLNAFNSLGIQSIHLGYIDALWRKKRKNNFLFKILGKFIPEFDCVYPTYRLHISQGKISKNDNELIIEIAQKLNEIFKKSGSNNAVFCPLGIGDHVDHVITRKIVEQVVKPIYWADQPYVLRSNLQVKNSFEFEFNNEKKNKLLSMYRTQIPALFLNGTIPTIKENFIFK
jgi:LmbE family N-acetylglucosaminyl deacetylase